MSNFPGGFDDDSTLPAVNDNITEIGGDAINALRDAVMQIEQTLGLNVQGVTPNLAARLGVFINSDGTPNASVLTSLGLVTLPIRNDQIAENAGIPESKLMLDFRTQDLFNYIRDLVLDVNTALGWINVSGSKLEPHLIGAIYRHTMDQINVSANSSSEPFLDNVQRTFRNNLNSYTLANDMNNELLAHQWADGSNGSILGPPFNITTNNGSVYTSLFAHVASGIYLDSSRFSVIPQNRDDLQLFAEYIDTESIFLLGTRIQNLYTNGITNVSTSSTLTADGYGQFKVPPTPAVAYLENNGNILLPYDNINSGDDIVQFVPSLANQQSFAFDSQFALVRPGDIVRVLYGDGYNIEVPYIIREKKYNPGTGPGTATYIVRIAGKNQAYSPNAIARIDASLSNNNKYGELAIAPVSNTLISGAEPSLIINNPRGAQALGNGLNLDELDENHYNLYLVLYPTGFASDGYYFLPGIDVTGNKGQTPGQYTLESIVLATNNAFRAPGYNYRFTAFSSQGNFGVCLADSYNNAAFSIISSAVTPSGVYDTLTNSLRFPNNVLDLAPTTSTVTTSATFTFPATTISVSSTAQFLASGSATVNTTTGTTTFNYTSTTTTSFQGVTGGSGTVLNGATVTQPLSGGVALDPLGIGPLGSNVASPPFLFLYGSSAASLLPTKLFIALRRNNYYVNGAELERLAIPNNVTILSTQAEDGYGDGYWVGTVQFNISPAGRVQKVYRVFQDLSVTNIAVGKTIVVQPVSGSLTAEILDYGRFIIENVAFNCAPSVYTDITVYDAVHGNGSTGISGTIAAGAQVLLYFSDDSATFNKENASDFSLPTPSSAFKRYFEVYVDDNGSNFTQERGRITLNSTGTPTVVNGVTLYGYGTQLIQLDIVTISPKLRGYQFGSVNKITLNMISLTASTGVYSGYLCSFDGTNITHVGPTTTGKLGEVTRFYDETNSDYIEISFASTLSLSSLSNQQLDFQLFPTLQLDTDVMLIGSCEVNDTNQTVTKIVDRRQFGSISEKDLSTSVFDYLSVPEKYFHSNGVVRGFDIPTVNGILSGGSKAIINMAGGVALVNGKSIRMNNETLTVPIVKESFNNTTYPVNWFLCLNDAGEYVMIPQLDYDPILMTPNAPTRTFTALDFVSSTTYTLPAITLTDMINRRPDLCVLYQISSTVTGVSTTPIITITVQDARRYSFKRDWAPRPALNVDALNGDFRNFTALNTWLNLNSTYSNSIILKGTFTDVNFTSSGLQFNSLVRFFGDGAANFTFSSLFTLNASNVEIDNLTLNPTNININTSTFNGCNMTFGQGSFQNSVVSGSTINTSGSSFSLQFNNSTFTNTTFNFASTNCTATFNNCIFNNCTFNYSTTYSITFANTSASVPSLVSGCSFVFGAGSNVTFNVFTSPSSPGEIITFNNNTFEWNNVTGQSGLNLGTNFIFRGNKFFINAGSPPTTFLNIADGSSGVIGHNYFYRGAAVLTNGYINGPASYTNGAVAIDNNFFDSTTCDGTSQILVKNLPIAWHYTNNLNTPPTRPFRIIAGPTAYTVVAIDDIILVNSAANNAITISLPATSTVPPGRVLTIKDISGNFDTSTLTLQRGIATDSIENQVADFTYQIPYGSLTLLAITGGWVII
jgi:hypothetical protein